MMAYRTIEDAQHAPRCSWSRRDVPVAVQSAMGGARCETKTRQNGSHIAEILALPAAVSFDVDSGCRLRRISRLDAALEGPRQVPSVRSRRQFVVIGSQECHR